MPKLHVNLLSEALLAKAGPSLDRCKLPPLRPHLWPVEGESYDLEILLLD